MLTKEFCVRGKFWKKSPTLIHPPSKCGRFRLQPYKKTSLKAYHCQKLAPKFYGPYTILKCGGPMAYKLYLPGHSKLQLAFHVSYLNKVIGSKCQIQTGLPELDEEGSIWLHSWTNVSIASVSAQSMKF
jgi:hypothetical protein